MEEIQVGEYVRINNDFRKICIGIGKVKSKNQDTIYVEMSSNDLPIFFDRYRIAKHSFNLIDLIEVNDYVNGHKVTAVYLDGATKYLKLDNAYKNGEGIRIYAEDIKSIVTHEQFSSLEYKVEEK